jgi:hypothetical protein
MHIWTQARLWPALINVLEEGSGDQTAKRGRFLYVYLWEGGVWGGSKIDGMVRVGQNRIYAPYMTVYLVIFLPKIPYIHNIYIWFWPTLLTAPRSGCEHHFAHRDRRQFYPFVWS